MGSTVTWEERVHIACIHQALLHGPGWRDLRTGEWPYRWAKRVGPTLTLEQWISTKASGAYCAPDDLPSERASRGRALLEWLQGPDFLAAGTRVALRVRGQ